MCQCVAIISQFGPKWSLLCADPLYGDLNPRFDLGIMLQAVITIHNY